MRAPRPALTPIATIGVAAIVAILAFGAVMAGPSAGQTTVSYWIDCETGVDAGDGSRSDPFTSIRQANQVIATTTYDNLIFARGTVCHTDESLILNADDVAVYQQPGGWSLAIFRPTIILDAGFERHGPAAVEITGTGVRLYDLRLILDSPATTGCGGVQAPVGSRLGISVEAQGDDGLIGYVDVSGFYAAVMLRGSGTEVRGSYLHDNNMVNIAPGGDDDAGAMGVLIWSDSNDIADNRFWNNSGCSLDYGRDGASVEIWAPDRNDGLATGLTEGAHHNRVFGNRIHNDQTMIEMGAGPNPFPGSLDVNQFTNNSFTSNWADASFIVLRGVGGSWGPPAIGTVIDGNLARIPDGEGDGVVCDGTDCSGSVADLFTLTQRNEICAGNWALWSPNVQIRQQC